MDSGKEGEAPAATSSPESRRTRSNGKVKAFADAAPPSATVVSTKATPLPRGGWKKGVAILDFIIRLGAIGSALGAAAIMGNSEQILPCVIILHCLDFFFRRIFPILVSNDFLEAHEFINSK